MMKTKLLLIILFISSIAFAQLPSGLLGEYKFTNGSLADDINGDDFIKTGTASTLIVDRFGASNNAISLNGDYLTRPRFTYGNDFSISFWIKTSTNDTNKRRIIDDFSATAGFYLYLENGKIGIVGIHDRTLSGQLNFYHTFIFVSNTDISDNEWHHITLTIEFDQIRNVANQLRGYIFNIDLYVDTVAEHFVDTVNGLNLYSVGSTANTGNVTVAHNRGNTIPNVNRYFDAIDDIHVYNRILSSAEVITVAENDGFCFAPDISALQISNITETTLDVSLLESGVFDIAYVLKGDPFSNAVITNITSTGGSVHTITGLSKSSLYDVYVRKVCSVAYTSGWSELIQIRTKGTLFVSVQAIGINDGTSWTNAYTDLQDAITASVVNQEIWVAAGVYKPHTSSISIYFEITKNGTKIYGGFNGTETQLSQRDFRVNETIFSGDLLGNDDANITFTNGSRNDNSSKIIYVNAHDFTLDGITVSDGHRSSPSNSFFHSGTALTKVASKTNLTIENCTFKNNVANVAGAAIYAVYSANNNSSYLKIKSTQFKNNTARYATSFYVLTNGLTDTLTATIENCLFDGNLATDINGTDLGLSGSAGWLRAYASGTTVIGSFTNNTYVNNKDDGTGSSLTNATRSTLIISQNQGTMTSDIQNCIFWNNKSRGTNTVAKSIGSFIVQLGTVTVGYSLDENNFSLIPLANTTNTISIDPLFTNTMNDFTLQPTSPAIDTGNNTSSSNILEDLLGAQRIFNTTVDMGCYEFGAVPLDVEDYQDELNFVLFPNPTKNTLHIQMDTVLEKAEIYNLLGQKVLESTAKTIDVSNLKSGIYLIKIANKKGSFVAKRFVKQ